MPDLRQWTATDVDGNVLVTSSGEIQNIWVGVELDGKTVTSVQYIEDVVEPPQLPEPVEPTAAEKARSLRTNVFARTLDRMNPLYYNSLTETQQTNLATWRQQWLDYPTSDTRPDATLIEGIF